MKGLLNLKWLDDTEVVISCPKFSRRQIYISQTLIPIIVLVFEKDKQSDWSTVEARINIIAIRDLVSSTALPATCARLNMASKSILPSWKASPNGHLRQSFEIIVDPLFILFQNSVSW